jgi:hypothetical protein
VRENVYENLESPTSHIFGTWKLVVQQKPVLQIHSRKREKIVLDLRYPAKRTHQAKCFGLWKSHSTCNKERCYIAPLQ